MYEPSITLTACCLLEIHEFQGRDVTRISAGMSASDPSSESRQLCQEVCPREEPDIVHLRLSRDSVRAMMDSSSRRLPISSLRRRPAASVLPSCVGDQDVIFDLSIIHARRTRPTRQPPSSNVFISLPLRAVSPF